MSSWTVAREPVDLSIAGEYVGLGTIDLERWQVRRYPDGFAACTQ